MKIILALLLLAASASATPPAGFIVTGSSPFAVPNAQPGNPLYVSGTSVPSGAAGALIQAKWAALKSLNASYNAVIVAGITVASGTLTVTLPATPASQQQFNGLLSLLNTAPMPPTVTITDIHGSPFTIGVPQYYTLIGSYGQQIAGLWNALLTAKSSVAAVTGTAALSKITLTDPSGQ
jgi:hypothetical protein